MHQMLIFSVSVNVRNFDLVQCIHENYNNMKQTQNQILKGGHVNICAEGDGLSVYILLTHLFGELFI